MSKTTEILPTVELLNAGQSPWLDYINRRMLRSGELKALIEEKGVMGVTSNPSIFQDAIGQPAGGYAESIKKLIRKGMLAFDVYDKLSIEDIQEACDLFMPVYKKSNGDHGFVSLEVVPGLAYDVEGTVKEAKRLFVSVGRPNVLIKVPATSQGLEAVRELIGQGINVNVTLIFSLRHYQAVAKAYMDGLGDYWENGGEDVGRIHSVASVFVSRLDTLVDKKLDSIIEQSPQNKDQQKSERLIGQSAVANSKIIFEEFEKIFMSEQFLELKNKGAKIQKLLWGSTSTKSPRYHDLIYVENLVGPGTVNTMPRVTLDALLDHGAVRTDSVRENMEDTRTVLQDLEDLGIDLMALGDTLQQKGVAAFIDSFDSLMGALEEVAEEMGEKKNKKSSAVKVAYAFGKDLTSEPVNRELKRLKSIHFRKRLIDGDASLWKADKDHQAVIKNRLGWFRVHRWILRKLYEVDILLKQLKSEKMKDVVLLGMGGSSLAPEVVDLVVRKSRQALKFHILDTTDPTSILKVEKKIKWKSTVFIVASKSGSTIETLSQFQYFYARIQKSLRGPTSQKDAGRHFIAITDAHSPLEKLGREKYFRKIFINPTDIGGRYSALSLFGMVPAALMGVDVRQLLRSAKQLFQMTLRESRLQENPGIYLGVVLGVLAKSGRNKLTFLLSKSLQPFGAWAEQLVAESTGKEGKGIIPIDGEEPAKPSFYKKDRFFVVMRLKEEKMPADWLEGVKKLKKAGFSVIEMVWNDESSVGSEFLRWEIATAVASAVLEINPFDEPNVKESKEITADILSAYGKKRQLKSPKGIVSVRSWIPFDRILSSVPEKGYLAILSYTERSSSIMKALKKVRRVLMKQYQIPVIIGFGPRYLHSIGQLYKGGPKYGRFIQLLVHDAQDIPIPEKGISFGCLKRAQAYGDAAALSRRKLPLLGIELGKDTVRGLSIFEKKLNDYINALK